MQNLQSPMPTLRHLRTLKLATQALADKEGVYGCTATFQIYNNEYVLSVNVLVKKRGKFKKFTVLLPEYTFDTNYHSDSYDEQFTPVEALVDKWLKSKTLKNKKIFYLVC